MVSDNASDDWATQDLIKINEITKAFDDDFDIEFLGFEDFKIESVDKYEGQDAGNIPTIDRNDIITKKGDIWILGDNRLMCGDSTMIDEIEKLMGGNKVSITFTSPPYNAGNEVEIGSKGQKYEQHNDDMSGGDYLSLLIGFTENALQFSDIVICNIQQLAGNKIEFIDYLHYFKENFVDMGIWNKTYGTPLLPHRVMNCAFEYLLFLSPQNKPPRTIKSAPDFHGNVQNVYTGSKQTKNEFSNIHRATFPIHLPEYIISTFSSGSVLDLFNGVGTTLIACEKLGKNYFGMELDPLYVDTTVKRWEYFTGKKAVLSDGNI